MDRAELLASVCALLDESNVEAAKATLLEKYPCANPSTPRKGWSLQRLVAIFVRDGFTDRYFGARLVFPGALRALSILVPERFPYHPNWKQGVTHPAFWELYPTIDHVIPVARGGRDDETNVVTTSMLKNSAKSNWLLEEMNWPTERAPTAPGWDGLMGWFMSAWLRHESLRADTTLRRWHHAAGASTYSTQS